MPTFTKKKYFKLAKGFSGRSKNCIRICAPKVEKSLCYAYRDRKVRPRILRRDWIQSMNAAVREHNINYSRFIWALNRSNVILNRKILSDLAANEPYSFKAVVDEMKVIGQLEEKKKSEISYLEAFSKGYLVNKEIKPKEEVKEETPEFGLRHKDKLTPEQIKLIMRL